MASDDSRVSMTDEEYSEAMGAYDDAVNEIAEDICDWANAHENAYCQAVGLMAVLWTAAGDPDTDEASGRSLATELVKHGRPDIAARIDALFAAAPWRSRPRLVERVVGPDDVRILDDDWVAGQWPQTVRAWYGGKTYTFEAPPQDCDLQSVAARAINFRVARLVGT